MTRHDTTRHDKRSQFSYLLRNFFLRKVGQVVSLTPTFVNWVVADKKNKKRKRRQKSRPGRTVRTSGPSILGTSFRIPGSRDSSFLRLLPFSSQPFFDLRERVGGTGHGTRHKLYQLLPLPIVTYFCGCDAADRKNVAFCYGLSAGLLFFCFFFWKQSSASFGLPNHYLLGSIFDTWRTESFPREKGNAF